MKPLIALAGLLVLITGRAVGDPLPMADGYRGIWYYNTKTNDEFQFKYSGGMGTYPQQHIPIAIYRKEVNKTFFVYGGTTGGEKPQLLHMVSYYDHASGKFPRPRILLNKQTTDAHDNPTLAIDDKGILYIFSNTHGPAPRSSIHRSTKPYSIEEFETVFEGNFSYG